MAHVVVALLIQSVVAAFLGWDAGAAAGMWYFVGREYAQAEYRWIEAYGQGLRANMPALTPLRDRRAWTRKGLLDWIFPTAAVCAVAYFLGMLNA